MSVGERNSPLSRSFYTVSKSPTFEHVLGSQNTRKLLVTFLSSFLSTKRCPEKYTARVKQYRVAIVRMIGVPMWFRTPTFAYVP